MLNSYGNVTKRRPTKIPKGIKKACMSVVTIEGLDSVVEAAKLINEQIECNVNIQTMRRVLKVASFQAQEKTKSLLQQKNV